MTRPALVRIALVVAMGVEVIGALALAGCSSGSGGGAHSTAGHGAASASQGSGSPADAATTREVTRAYVVFFAAKTPVALAVQNLQHGAVFRTALAAQSTTGPAQHLSARVLSVRLISPDVAAVRFDLLSGSSVLLPDSAGNAVREQGSWKVAARTYCSLVRLSATPPAPCSDAAITALPK